MLRISVILLLCCSVLPSQTPERTNLVVFLVDDMGWQDTSVPFHTEVTPLNCRYRTPNMRVLADRGMKFTNAYAMPVCTPTMWRPTDNDGKPVAVWCIVEPIHGRSSVVSSTGPAP